MVKEGGGETWMVRCSTGFVGVFGLISLFY
jgi:hypothetical protein